MLGNIARLDLVTSPPYKSLFISLCGSAQLNFNRLHREKGFYLNPIIKY